MKVLILNLHSALNLGDEAIMLSTIERLRSVFPSVQIIAAANDPRSWRKFQGIEVVNSLCNWFGDCRLGRFRSRSFLAPPLLLALILAGILYRFFNIKFYFGSNEKKRLLQAYYEADLILSCGGGNFYANRPFSPALIWNLLTLIFPKVLRKKVVMLPQSIGPITGKIQQKITSLVLGHMDLTIVRETYSYNYVASVLKSNTRMVVMPDLAIGLQPRQTLQEKLNICTTKSPRIGLTLIDRGAQNPGFNQQKYEETIAHLITRIHHEHGAQIHLFVQCYGPSADQDDRLVSKRIYQRLKETTSMSIHFHANYQNAFEIIDAYREMDCIIGTRMHTAIFGFNAYTPVILIGYQPKSIGVMTLFNMEKYYVDINELEITSITTLVNDIITNKERIISQIAHTYNMLQQSLLESFVKWVT